jgi:hypothetical protein
MSGKRAAVPENTRCAIARVVSVDSEERTNEVRRGDVVMHVDDRRHSSAFCHRPAVEPCGNQDCCGRSANLSVIV